MQVGPICESVRQEGDAAVRQLTEKFDKVKLDDICVAVQVCELTLLHRSCSVPCTAGMHDPHFLQVL
jgi:histidinol dehydrogenase